MDQLPSLEDVFPPWKAISNRYDSLFLQIEQNIGDSKKHEEKAESLFWEQWGFEIIVTFLLARKIPFEINADDVQPLVKDINGNEVEIDFSIRIRGQLIYFGVTHFYHSLKDLKKDVEQVDLDIFDLKRNGVLTSKQAKITSVRSHDEYLNRRMCVRIAKEGNHHFAHDYIYIFFPKIPYALDGISNKFTLDTNGKYFYKHNGINGILIVALYIEIAPKHSRAHDEKLLLRSFSFERCSELGKYVLASFDQCTLDISRRSEQIRRFLEQKTAG